MLNYQKVQDLDFSEKKSKSRIERLNKIFGKTVVKRIIAFALFLLGADRNDIAKIISTPSNTLFSLLTRLSQNGVDGFLDKRQKYPSEISPPSTPLAFTINEKNEIVIDNNSESLTLKINPKDTLGKKVILLTFLSNKLLSTQDVAKELGFSTRHTNNLLKTYQDQDAIALIDQRNKGQVKDYVFTSEVKSALIVQFALNASQNKKTSGNALANDLKNRCGIELSERSIRYYLTKLGLINTKEIFSQLKKSK